jgi:hypothetical protein
VLDQAELEKFDANQSTALNGDAGGTWSPTSYITIGGAYGIVCTAPLLATGDSTLSGDCSFCTSVADTFVVNGVSTFHHNVSCDTDIAATGILSGGGDCYLGTTSANTVHCRGTLLVTAPATFSGTVGFSGLVVVGDNSSDTLTVHSTLNSDAPANLLGDTVIGPNGGATTLTVAATTDVTGPLQVHGLSELHAQQTLYSPILPAAGGYVRDRVLITNSAGAYPSIEYYDVAIHTTAGTCFLENYGEDGASIRIVNASAGNLIVEDAVTSHVLRTLPTMTWLIAVRTNGAGSYGWSSAGEGPYVAFT